ncbi:MAG: sporulation protein YqfD [Oscillospiraceae bacterium]|nr:sporulation protein YqfD [Oscillospiraceae bacterium]
MELWWRLMGWTRLRLTCADCAARLRRISGEMKLVDITFPDELTAEFTLSTELVRGLLDAYGEELTIIGGGGLPVFARRLWSWRGLAVWVLLLGLLTAVLPKRVWFITVQGNVTVPTRLILERAEDCGVHFGAKSGEIRSERVKNRLLFELPELRWAGVNTSGCSAFITVAERQQSDGAGEMLTGDLVARVDGVVMEVILQRGTALVKPGNAVREGQLLISGLTDLGICTRADRAEGEVWGLTRREIQTVLPSETVSREKNGGIIRKCSLRIGKKSVNFSNDSGILHGTCVKMRTVNYLALPGGFRLPVALVTDTYYLCETGTIPRGETDWLADAAHRTVLEQLRGGLVLRESITREGNVLTAVFECREQLGVFCPGDYMERDTVDRENGERRTG